MPPEEGGYPQAPNMVPHPPVMDRRSPSGTVPPTEAVPEPNPQQRESTEVIFDLTCRFTKCSTLLFLILAPTEAPSEPNAAPANGGEAPPADKPDIAPTE